MCDLRGWPLPSTAIIMSVLSRLCRLQRAHVVSLKICKLREHTNHQAAHPIRIHKGEIPMSVSPLRLCVLRHVVVCDGTSARGESERLVAKNIHQKNCVYCIAASSLCGESFNLLDHSAKRKIYYARAQRRQHGVWIVRYV